MGTAGGAAAGAAAAAIAQAIKASGAIVRVEPEAFEQVVARVEAPLVVMVVPSGLFSRNYEYLVSYKGLTFYAKSRTAIHLPGDAEIIAAKTIWIPA